MNREGYSLWVDPANPGQFLACCGLLDLADRWWPGGAKGWFGQGQFHLKARVQQRQNVPHPVRVLVQCEAEPVKKLAGCADAEIRDILSPLRLTPPEGFGPPILLDAWLDWGLDKDIPLWKGNRWQLWAGQQTPQRIWEPLVLVLRDQLSRMDDEQLPDLLQARAMLSGRFGFDPGAAWNPVDVGFSPNEQKLRVASSAATELLAAAGLQRFRLKRDRSGFSYAIWTEPLSPLAASLAATQITNRPGETSFRGSFLDRGQYGALGQSLPLKGN
jgi:CRISPR-associated protein Csx14